MDKPNTYHHGNLREALLERAVEVIGEQGVEGVSLRALARDLGVSHGAPARHFKSKADLLAGIAIEGYRQMTEAILAAAAAAGDDPVLRLRAIARAAIHWARDHTAYFSAINNPDVNRYAADELQVYLPAFVDGLRGAVSDAQAAGYRTQEDPVSMLMVGISATIGAGMIFSETLHYRVLGPMTDDALIEAVIDQIAPLPEGTHAPESAED